MSKGVVAQLHYRELSLAVQPHFSTRVKANVGVSGVVGAGVGEMEPRLVVFHRRWCATIIDGRYRREEIIRLGYHIVEPSSL